MKISEIIENKTPMLTDGGLETTLIFHHQIDMPHFAAFPLVKDARYKGILIDYYKDYLEVAIKNKTGFILEAATWRANTDWGFKLGYSQNDLDTYNTIAIKQLIELSEEYRDNVTPILVSGCIGPRNDGYRALHKMKVKEAIDYHALQISTFKKADADLVTALTMNYFEEAMGIVIAAKENNMPVVISFTVETDGNLPSGESLNEVIRQIDFESDNYPAYFMINCAYPEHFMDKLESKSHAAQRIMGVRANASCKSHAELDESTELDAGDKSELAKRYQILREKLPNLIVYGGCCGTDHTHIEAICHKIDLKVPALY